MHAYEIARAVLGPKSEIRGHSKIKVEYSLQKSELKIEIILSKFWSLS